MRVIRTADYAFGIDGKGPKLRLSDLNACYEAALEAGFSSDAIVEYDAASKALVITED